MKECLLYKKLGENKTNCTACAHRCIIEDGKTGICGVRKNIKGKLCLLVYEKPISLAIDPVEKKPLYHFMPLTKTFSFGTVGCNFKCLFCQNYDISQSREIKGYNLSPKEIVKNAKKSKCQSISYTYNEPTIFIEFVRDTAKIAKKNKLKNILVTNGYMTKEALEFLADENLIEAMNIDLKSMDDDFYIKNCKARLKPVLETIKRAYEKKIHIEITTLVIPGENDSVKEIEKIAKFISSLSKEIPWHISRFFPMYKMSDKLPTDLDFLKKAEKTGKKYLKFVYLGNVNNM